MHIKHWLLKLNTHILNQIHQKVQSDLFYGFLSKVTHYWFVRNDVHISFYLVHIYSSQNWNKLKHTAATSLLKVELKTIWEVTKNEGNGNYVFSYMKSPLQSNTLNLNLYCASHCYDILCVWLKNTYTCMHALNFNIRNTMTVDQHLMYCKYSSQQNTINFMFNALKHWNTAYSIIVVYLQPVSTSCGAASMIEIDAEMCVSTLYGWLYCHTLNSSVSLLKGGNKTIMTNVTIWHNHLIYLHF